MDGIDKNTFKKIFYDHWDTFRQVYPRFDTPDYNETIQKMLDCGDSEKMGFVQYRCCSCGETHRIAFTCKSCFCLSCAKVYIDRWADFIGRRLLPGVTYRHVVLTMPEFLRLWFFRNPTLLSPFMRAGHACLKDVLDTCAGVKLDIGNIIVLQTAGRSGHYNPHLHILMTAGGLNPQQQWKTISYIPYELMHKKWQYHLLNMLRESITDPVVEKDIDRAWREYPNGFVAFLQEGDVPPRGKGLGQYLAKYVVSPPISVRRIESYDGQSVSYWYRDHKTGQIEHKTLPALQFVRCMVQHILPKGFQRIRYYGLHGNACYKRVRESLSEILPAQMPDDSKGYRVLPPKPFAQRFFESFGTEPLICAKCGDDMVVELIYHPKYGIVKQYKLFEEITDEQQRQFYGSDGGISGVQQCSQPMVQLSLPGL
ncbi:MAG: transposase [Desulfobacterales bacterium]|nr:transposase [Desulfobacterales bacterium]